MIKIFFRVFLFSFSIQPLLVSNKEMLSALIETFILTQTEILLSYVSFTGSVKLKSIIISGEDDDTHPAEIRL